MAGSVETHDWRFVTDQVMGGVSTGQMALSSEGLHLTGKVSTANNGGFVQVRAPVGPFSTDTKGLRLDIRGDGQTYFIHLRTKELRRPWHYYQAKFETTQDWQQITLPWSAFKPSNSGLTKVPEPESIQTIALVAYGRDHEADVWLRRFTPY
ncbi:MAG: CIA30 family protein [Marinovum sp.]|nr:CIA30 family protein [Marinovum sp.]